MRASSSAPVPSSWIVPAEQHVGAVGDGERLLRRAAPRAARPSRSSAASRSDGEQPLDDQRGETERELVDEQQAGTGRQGPGQHEHLLLAAREQPGLAVEEPFELGEEREGAVHASGARGRGWCGWTAGGTRLAPR